MARKPVVYVSRITNLSDARYCAGMGVDMIGIVIDRNHPDYVSPQKYKEMIGWISGPRHVAEFTTTINIDQVIKQYAVDFFHIQFASLPQVQSNDIPLLVEISWEEYMKGTPVFNQEQLHTIAYLIITGVPIEVNFHFPETPSR